MTKAFINCPFDAKYNKLFKAIIITLRFFKIQPLISSKNGMSTMRLAEIEKLCKDCEFSIHDISRNKYEEKSKSKFARYNMPFELGLLLGLKRTKIARQNIFVVDSIKHEYKITISDISGYDIYLHKNNTTLLIQELYEFLHKTRKSSLIKKADPSFIIAKFIDFEYSYNKTFDKSKRKMDFNSVIEYSNTFIRRIKNKK